MILGASTEDQPPSPPLRVADHIFELFSKPLRVALLAELATGANTRSDLLDTLGAAESTLDALLNELDESHLITRERSREFPTQTNVSLAPGAGRDLIVPLSHAARWLAKAGLGPLRDQDPRAARLAAHLAWCWHHGLFDLLAIGPASMKHLVEGSVAGSVSSVQAHLRQLVAFGVVEVTSRTPGRANLYAFSRLGVELVGVLAAFVRWELRHHPGTAARLTGRDVATAIRMACTLIDPSRIRPGRYAFVVNLVDGPPAGLVVHFSPDNWRVVANPTGRIRYGIRADPLPWLDAILDLKIPGDADDPAERLVIRPADCNFIELVHEAISRDKCRATAGEGRWLREVD